MLEEAHCLGALGDVVSEVLISFLHISTSVIAKSLFLVFLNKLITRL